MCHLASKEIVDLLGVGERQEVTGLGHNEVCLAETGWQQPVSLAVNLTNCDSGDLG